MYINDITSVIKNIVYSINMDSEYLKWRQKTKARPAASGLTAASLLAHLTSTFSGGRPANDFLRSKEKKNTSENKIVWYLMFTTVSLLCQFFNNGFE